MLLTAGLFPPGSVVNPSTFSRAVGQAYLAGMNRLVAALALVLAAVVAAPSGPVAAAAGSGRIDWFLTNWAAGVQMTDSDPSAADPHAHVRFKRVGGDGQREVRMGERVKVSGTHRWGPYRYTRPVLLRVGQKVIFTTKHALPCEPAKDPLGITMDMRIKAPGKGWGDWVSWATSDYILLDCSEGRASLG
jgi:hypothetical protein